MGEQNQQIRMTPEGEEVVVRQSHSSRIAMVVIKLVFIAVAVALLYWSAPALQAYFERREITGAARHLEHFQLSERGTLAAIVAWCILLVWWGIGGLYDILKLQLERDRFLLRPDMFQVQRRSTLTREYTFKPYEALTLRLRPSDGALEATTNRGSSVLTNLGTEADRKWLLELLQRRYRLQPETAAPQQTKRESIATYNVERRPDGSVLIASSTTSTVGCAVIAVIACAALAGLAVWLFSKGNGAGFLPIMFLFAIALAGLSSLNRRFVEASRGRLRVRWTSPVGRILARFLPPNNVFLQTAFGEGEYLSDTGKLVLHTRIRQKGSTTHHIMLLQKDDEGAESFDEENDGIRQLVLDLSGNEVQHSANYLIDLLSETTGFPRVPNTSSNQ